jgi:hypothetical protein
MGYFSEPRVLTNRELLQQAFMLRCDACQADQGWLPESSHRLGFPLGMAQHAPPEKGKAQITLVRK